jgi:hypothetical protein
VLHGKQIRQQLDDDSSSFSGISQDADIDIIERSDPDAKINRADLSDNGSARQVQM